MSLSLSTIRAPSIDQNCTFHPHLSLYLSPYEQTLKTYKKTHVTLTHIYFLYHHLSPLPWLSVPSVLRYILFLPSSMLQRALRLPPTARDSHSFPFLLRHTRPPFSHITVPPPSVSLFPRNHTFSPPPLLFHLHYLSLSRTSPLYTDLYILQTLLTHSYLVPFKH